MIVRLTTLLILGTLLICGSWSQDDSITVEAEKDLFSLGAALMQNIATASPASDVPENNATLRQYAATSIKQVDTIMFQPFCNRELFTTAIGVCDAIFPPLPCPCPKCPKCPICPKCTCPPGGVLNETINYWCADSGATSPRGRLLYNASMVPATASTACNFAVWVKSSSDVTFTCTELAGMSMTWRPLTWLRPNIPPETPVSTGTPVKFGNAGALFSVSSNSRPTALNCSWTSVESVIV